MLLSPWNFLGKNTGVGCHFLRQKVAISYSGMEPMSLMSPTSSPGDSDSKESTCNVRDGGLIPGLEDDLKEDMATHSSILVWRIPMDKGTWWAAVHRATESDMTQRLSTAPPGKTAKSIHL